MKILSARCADLPAVEWERLEELAEAEFSQYALVRETEWAQPDWCFRAFVGEEFAAFHNIILRTVRVDGIDVRVAGLNNVITVSAFRGRGVGSEMLRKSVSAWFALPGVECGMLLCADPLVHFYSKLQWRRLDAKVTYAQSTGARTWVANCMVLDPRGLIGSPHEVDLCGQPW